jgi:uncharacterized membrane protein
MQKFTVRAISMIAIMAAATFAASHISIPIPTALGNTRIHLGNIICLLSGMILGPVGGGLAAGIGSMFYDFTNPIFLPYAPFTLVSKFMMAFVCGLIVWRGKGAKLNSLPTHFVAGFCGAFTYIAIYLGQTFAENVFFRRTEVITALIDISTKGIVSGFNGVLAFIAAAPLAFALRRGLDKAGFKIQ